MKRHRLTLLLAATVLLGLLAGGSSALGQDAITVRIGWAGSPDTLNPGVGVLSESYTIYELVYDSMYQLNLDGTYSLELAKSVDVSDDGTVWTFTLWDGITWHDGEPLTASDVAFTYNLYQNNPGLSIPAGLHRLFREHRGG